MILYESVHYDYVMNFDFGGFMKEWDKKRYYSLDYFLKNKFYEKVFKIPLDAGFTCPNRDGMVGFGGCIFCSSKGSGDFAKGSTKSISHQFDEMKIVMEKKWKSKKYIAYFQAYTNTYGEINRLKSLYYEALNQDGVVGIAIATRPDCLSDDVLSLLDEINKKSYLWVELGLQTSNDEIAKFINRGYETKVFDEACEKLNRLGIDSVVHVIFGLPKEDRESMLNTIRYVCSKNIQGIKMHLLYLVYDSLLYEIHKVNPIIFLTKDEYIDLICTAISIIPDNIVIHRITGDAPRETLVEPKWSLKKWEILNEIDDRLKKYNIYQGIYSYSK